jgi:tRNA(Ile)-lysidine synthetase-like protein
MDMETGAEATLPGNISLRLEYDHILIASSTEPQPINQPQISLGLPLTLPIPGTVALEGDWRLTAVESDLNLSTVRENRDSLTAFLDIGETDALQVRTRLPGERMQPLGMDGRSASVQDIMVNRKLPAHLRDQWPLVADAKHLLWLVGLHVDERAKVTEQTQRIIHISCNQAGGKQES